MAEEDGSDDGEWTENQLEQIRELVEQGVSEDDAKDYLRQVEEQAETVERLQRRGVPSEQIDDYIDRTEDELEEIKRRFRGEDEESIYRKAIIDRVSAEIGGLEFLDEFSNPDVDVTHDRQTAEHEIVSGHRQNQDVEYVIQTLGREPIDITVNGWVSEEQLTVVDSLISEDYVDVVTDRWVGIGVPIHVDVPYERAFHDKHGRIYEITIDLLGVRRGLDSEGDV